MQKIHSIKLLPSEAGNEQLVKKYIAAAMGVQTTSITGYLIKKRSIDARGRQAWMHLTLKVYIDEPWQSRKLMDFEFHDTRRSPSRIIIIGAGPAGLFAALRLIEKGIKPIIIERGKDVRARRRDLAILNKEGIVNPESNYCFGEGGAGTYSDGKLYTRSTKRGDVDRILNLLVHFGADEAILYESHPHIGTNKLPGIITAMRKKILECGGDILFENKVTDLRIDNQLITGVQTNGETIHTADAVILATGHSARDIFHLLNDKKLLIELKPFALGVRVEHPQALIDNVQYHCDRRNEFLPPASYNWAQQVDGKGVFSFCMCPGGIIAPAATDPGELVVNGWSPSKRNNPYANSGIVVTVEKKDALEFFGQTDAGSDNPLLLMKFQQDVERKAFQAGGGKFIAPAQGLGDFLQDKLSSSLPGCSYLPGVRSVSLKEVLPAFIHQSLQQGFREFGKKMRGYITNDAIVIATESRTSSPVRIPRNAQLQHPQASNLYPCGEGAGYAGGIVSAAMDGERVADMIAVQFLPGG